MSWQYSGENWQYSDEIIAVRKVPHDELWHIVYKWGKKETYDRITQREALKFSKMLHKLNDKTARAKYLKRIERNKWR